jgi:GNAT superfamily N-acetyltransferase
VTPKEKPKKEQGANLTVRTLQTDDWPTIVQLFGEKGACGGCWCMWPRVPRGGKLWQECKGKPNRDNFRRLIRADRVHGVLAFAGAEPVGWCSFGPRQDFPRLETVRALKRQSTDETWSIVCFYILPRWRGRGVATRLLEAATVRAFALGAREVEGYPVVPRTDRMPGVFAWTGVPALFERQGYSELDRPEASRPIFIQTRPRRKRTS